MTMKPLTKPQPHHHHCFLELTQVGKDGVESPVLINAASIQRVRPNGTGASLAMSSGGLEVKESYDCVLCCLQCCCFTAKALPPEKK